MRTRSKASYLKIPWIHITLWWYRIWFTHTNSSFSLQFACQIARCQSQWTAILSIWHFKEHFAIHFALWYLGTVYCYTIAFRYFVSLVCLNSMGTRREAKEIFSFFLPGVWFIVQCTVAIVHCVQRHFDQHPFLTHTLKVPEFTFFVKKEHSPH